MALILFTRRQKFDKALSKRNFFFFLSHPFAMHFIYLSELFDFFFFFFGINSSTFLPWKVSNHFPSSSSEKEKEKKEAEQNSALLCQFCSSSICVVLFFFAMSHGGSSCNAAFERDV